MRLINTTELDSGAFSIEEFTDYNTPPYAILSHTWEQGEVSLQDISVGGARLEKRGFEKIQTCCSLALASGFEYVWIDTCCIDKTSSAELSEAINSMYRWYEEAEVCYTYLADVPSRCQFQDSRWFSRGWTLQELIAPTNLIFLDETWKKLGSKHDSELQNVVSNCTQIPIGLLSGEEDLDMFSVAQKMSWAAGRETSRVEDQAYSLMGLFGVNMPLIYGERETSFIRLQEEILRITDDHTIFALKHRDNRAGLLATSPSAFASSKDIVRSQPLDSFGSSPVLSSRGIYLEVRLLGIGRQCLGLAILDCKYQNDTKNGKDKEEVNAIYVRDLTLTMELFTRVESTIIKQVDFAQFRPSQYPVRRICIQVNRNTRRRDNARELFNLNNIGVAEDQVYSRLELFQLMSFDEPKALLEVAKNGNKDVLWLLLTRNDIEIDGAKTGSGQTALALAAQHGHEDCLNMLLQRGASIDGQKGAIGTPLNWAAKNRHHNIVKILLEKGAAIESDETFRHNLLSWAAENGHEAIIKQLFNRGVAIDVKGFQSYVPLANTNGHEGVIDLLHLHVLEEHSKAGTKVLQSPLFSAVLNGLDKTVIFLLEQGADLEARDELFQTPLHHAIIRRRESVVKILLKRGADLEAKDAYLRTPLRCVTDCGDEAIAMMLLDEGAFIEAGDKTLRTPLHRAAINGHEGIVELLLERGAYIQARDNDILTPLHLAAQFGHEGIVQLLLQRGTDIEAKDIHLRTPLHHAAEQGQENVVELLLENGAKIDVKDENGETPLSQKVKTAYPEIAGIFLSRHPEVLAITGEQRHRPLLQRAFERRNKVLGKLRDFKNG